MKRYERMSKEAIMEAFKTTNSCSTCMFHNSVTHACTAGKDCCDAVAAYLNEEIKAVSRWQTIKSDDDLVKMSAELTGWCANHECAKCVYRSTNHSCLMSYLLEKIEVEETV